MSAWQACVLGAIQGLGEFLPISSSGHLIVLPWLMDWPDHGLAFDVALHVGTLVAVLVAFATDWWRMGRAAVTDLVAGKPFTSEEGHLLLLLAVGTVPGAALGLLLEDWVETTLRSPIVVASSLALVALILAAADRTSSGERRLGGMPLSHVLLIGLAQAAALVPGVSRSGATISAALFLGYPRREAARFSFWLAVPITAGAAALKLPELLGAQEIGPIVIGVATAGVFGLAAIRGLLAWVRTRSFMPFVVYRLALATLILGLYARM
jgi:undecaprenyl-diphosphatase